MKLQFGNLKVGIIHSLVFVGLAVAACSRNNGDQGQQQPIPLPPVTNQYGFPIGNNAIPGQPLPSVAQSGLADNSRRALAVIMGTPVANVSFLVSNYTEDSNICRYESVGPDAARLAPVNANAMLYFTRSMPTVKYSGYRITRGCRIHQAVSVQFDFGADAILSATVQMNGEVFRGTRIPYSWSPNQKDLLISDFEVHNGNTASAVGDVIKITSEREVYLDRSRRVSPGFRARWQPEFGGRGHLTPQHALGASQMRVYGALTFQFGKQTPSQTIHLQGSQANVNLGWRAIDAFQTKGTSYMIPIQGSILDQPPVSL